jgi:hypothetical protein
MQPVDHNARDRSTRMEQRTWVVQLEIVVTSRSSFRLPPLSHPDQVLIVSLSGQDEIVGMHAGGQHVLQEQRIMSVKGDQRIATLLLYCPWNRRC